ncbi:hypothetical protein [Streptomyces sclerotialus]|uniref:hypothetical protein n=1 Tax=Streptomyces sclerotialus TaxID=1957 RepID=UPI0004C97E3A
MRTRLAAGAAAAASMIILLGAPVAAAYAPAAAAGAAQAADPGDEDPVNGPASVPGDPQPEPQGVTPGEQQNTTPGLQPGVTTPGNQPDAGQNEPPQQDATKGETPEKGTGGLLGGKEGKGLLGLGLLGL